MSKYTFSGKSGRTHDHTRKLPKHKQPKKSPAAMRRLTMEFVEADTRAHLTLEGFGPGKDSVMKISIDDPQFSIEMQPITNAHGFVGWRAVDEYPVQISIKGKVA